ncbi:MAG: ABC transporter ATP-binding protein [Synergistaceae bacterium]|nr:ABC transporter ATP-binding protein [Synergistaceae bacterium]
MITCENLSIGWDNRVIIKNLNFCVKSGDYLCIMGENGSGKSTLIKTILGLNKPLSGRIIFTDGLKKNEIGYLPQQKESQKDFPASVREIVLSGFQGRCGLRPFYNKREKIAAFEIMQKMKISDLEFKCYRELSGGQQQRVLLARALCAAQKVLILDEPITGLDPESASEMYLLLNELNRDKKIAIIMISHDIDKAAKYAKNLLRLDKSC